MPLSAAAQDDGQSRLVTLLENALSDDATRQVQIDGFRGALNSVATLDRLTIEDEDGVWLVLEDVSLDWNRSALFSRALEVNELTAARLSLARLPAGGDDLPDAEATPFSLPELPLRVNIDLIAIDRVEIAEPVFGQAVVFSVAGEARLADGEGAADIALERLDGPEGAFMLQAKYDNETRNLAVDLELIEASGGLAASLLGIPGEPSVTLAVDGEGPLDAFDAQFALRTDGEPRLAGDLSIVEADAGGRRVALDVSGDVTAIVLPEYRPFFGPHVSILAEATQDASGALILDPFRVETATVDVEGRLALDAERRPESFALDGRIAPQEGSGDFVRLPTGADVQIGSALIEIGYDRSRGNTWTGDIAIDRLILDQAQVERLALDLSGQITESDTGISGVTATVEIAADGIAHDDPAVAEAAGEAVFASANLFWNDDEPVRVTNLRVAAGGLQVEGQGEGSFDENRLDLNFAITAEAEALARFAAITGQDLSGAATLSIDGTAEPLSGAFDVTVAGETIDLQISDAVPPELFAGTTELSGDIRRDDTGVTVDGLALQGQQLTLLASGSLSSGDSDLIMRGQLRDAAIYPSAPTGPVIFDASVQRNAEGPWTINSTLTGPGELALELAAEVGSQVAAGADTIADRLGIRFDATTEIGALSEFAELAGQDLSGATDLTIAGTAEIQSGDFNIAVEGQARNLRVSDAVPPELFAGVTDLSGSIQREDTVITIKDFELEGQELTLSARGSLGSDDSDLVLTGRLRNAAVFTDALSGSISLGASLQQRDGQEAWTVDTTLAGPGGMVLTLDGRIDLPGNSVDLGLTGTVPLALADQFIAPRSIRGNAALNLRINGAPTLANLGGQIAIDGARVAAPTVGFSLENVSADIDVSGGTAQIAATTDISTGGQIAVNGSVAFTGRTLPAQFDIAVTSATLVDPTLYEATIPEARLRYAGNLTGAARLSGEVLVGETEVRIPETSLGGAEAVPPITHINDTAAERRTRAFAGLLEDEAGNNNDGGSGAGGNLALDITVNAPGRIFLRGRGLDAELGGTLRLTGTASNVVPSGRFDLIRGRLAILGQRLDLDEGSATLTGDFDPVIRLIAQTRSGEYIIRIIVAGAVSDPSVTFTSQPGLPEDEVLSQLFFGRSVSNLSALQAIQLADAVAGLAGGGAGGGLLAGLRENLGLDDLDIQTGDEGGAAVRAGQYLSENIYTDLTLGSDGNTEVNLNIDISPGITARGSFGSDGDSSLGVFFERDY